MIKVEHENGYTGIVYGKSSISVYKDNEEVLHTGSLIKPFKTEKEVYEYLDKLLDFFKELDENMDKILADEEE